MSLNVLSATLSKTPRCLLMISRLQHVRPAASVMCVTHTHHCQTRTQTVLRQERRHSSTEVISPPHIEGEDKLYTPKIQELVSDITQLTLVEVADLNELLKKTLNITDTPMMAMGAMAAAAPAQEEEEDEVKHEKVVFTVKLTKFDAAKKVALIKEIKKQLEGMNLVQSKKFVESLPQDVKKDVSKDDADKLKAALEAAGGSVEID